MSVIKIKFNSLTEIYDFVKLTSKNVTKISAYDDKKRYKADAKSILGICSLNVSEGIYVEYNTIISDDLADFIRSHKC